MPRTEEKPPNQKSTRTLLRKPVFPNSNPFCQFRKLQSGPARAESPESIRRDPWAQMLAVVSYHNSIHAEFLGGIVEPVPGSQHNLRVTSRRMTQTSSVFLRIMQLRKEVYA